MGKYLAGLLLAATFAVAPAAAETPKDTLVVAKNVDDLITLDPAEIYENSGGEIAVNIYDRLVGLEPEDWTRLVPTAAESYTVSEDGKTFTFVLRPNMKFHSGNPVTAEDAAFSIQRVIKLNLTPAYILGPLGWTPENVDTLITAVDERTLKVVVPNDLAPTLVLNCLSTVAASIVDKQTVMAHEKDGDLGHEWLKTNSAGSGAFALKSWKPNEVVIMEASPDFRRGAPKIERLILRHIAEPAAQRLLLEKGDVDMARTLSADQVQGILDNPDIVVEASPKATIYYLGLSQKIEPLANPKVRQALRWLIDYEGMADTFLRGKFKVHQSYWPSGFFASLTDTPFKLDVAKGKQLLAEAGYPDGFEVELDVSNSAPYSEIAQSIQSTFAQAGIKVSIVPGETKQVLTKYRARNQQLVIMYWGPDFLDPHANTESFARNPDNSDGAEAKPLAWRNSWDIPDLSAKTVAAMKELDPAKREAMYLDIQRTIQADSPFIVMFQETEQIASRKGVEGFHSGPNADLVYYWSVSK